MGRGLVALVVLLCASCTADEVLYDRPPPPREEAVEQRTGFIWVHGRWERTGGLWVWQHGHYEATRAGFRYLEGHWEPRGNYYLWVDGGWRPVTSH
jgi:hypothetical protein